jgi:hypothetical protein
MNFNKNIIITDSDDEEILCDEINEQQESEFMKKCEILLNKLTKNYREHRDEIRNLMKLHKQELKKQSNKKKGRKSKDKIGFTKPGIVPNKLVEFLGLEKGTIMSRPEVTKLLCIEFKKRNLYHKKDERIIIPDNDVKKLFCLPKDADKSNDPKDKNGLNFYNLQHYVAQCYNEIQYRTI